MKETPENQDKSFFVFCCAKALEMRQRAMSKAQDAHHAAEIVLLTAGHDAELAAIATALHEADESSSAAYAAWDAANMAAKEAWKMYYKLQMKPRIDHGKNVG
jgi:hypothetical protein